MPDQENDQQRTDRPAVLVIDDDKAYTKVMAMVLGEYGFDSFPGNSAEDAWELLGRITPDLVLLDVMMPEIDGITFSRRISCECGVPCGPGPGGYGIYRDPRKGSKRRCFWLSEEAIFGAAVTGFDW